VVLGGIIRIAGVVMAYRESISAAITLTNDQEGSRRVRAMTAYQGNHTENLGSKK
jgi:hypothetical protein